MSGDGLAFSFWLKVLPSSYSLYTYVHIRTGRLGKMFVLLNIGLRLESEKKTNKKRIE